jgi:hypothetical protein
MCHSNLYLFHQPGKKIGWIGSANLTRTGFQQNDELMYEFSDEDNAASEWFERLWGALPEDCTQTLHDYRGRWNPPRPPSPLPRQPGQQPRAKTQNIHAVGQSLTDWPSFVAGIAEAEEYWRRDSNQPVTGDVRSCLNMITVGKTVVRRKNWDFVSTDDRLLILGLPSIADYLSLDYFSSAAPLDADFDLWEPIREALTNKAKIRAALEPVLTAEDADFADAACRFIAEVNKIPGFNGEVATRILSLARPDRAIFVHQAASNWLAKLTNLPEDSLSTAPHGQAHSYRDLLHWFEDKPWYSTPEPKDVYQRMLADARAALFDVFLCNTLNGYRKQQRKLQIAKAVMGGSTLNVLRFPSR